MQTEHINLFMLPDIPNEGTAVPPVTPVSDTPPVESDDDLDLEDEDGDNDDLDEDDED